MTQMQLPAHLQGRQVKSLTERASEGMGGALPPHVSIQGNTFTFIDAAGNEMAPMPQFSAVVVDISDNMNKRYYDKPYEPGSDEPPRCWSANGITPSREIAAPISATCDICPMNVRGSAISRISGSAIKACRDERWIAFIVPQLPQVIFRIVITPGSFQNWKAYTETLRGHGIELSLVLTQFSFVPKETGMLQFANVGWIDEPTLVAVEAANKEGKTDVLVGRSDPVRQPALAAPVAAASLPAPGGVAPASQPQQEVIPPGQSGFGGQVAAQAPFAAFTAMQPSTAAASPSSSQPPAGAAQTASPSEAPRRRRRSAAEAPAAGPAAAPAFGQATTAAPQAPFGQPAQAAPAAAPSAPFGQAAAPAAGQFGIGGATPVNADMAAMLAQMGFVRAPQQ